MLLLLLLCRLHNLDLLFCSAVRQLALGFLLLVTFRSVDFFFVVLQILVFLLAHRVDFLISELRHVLEGVDAAVWNLLLLELLGYLLGPELFDGDSASHSGAFGLSDVEEVV